MSKIKKDDRQRELDFNFINRVEAHLKEKQEIIDKAHESRPQEKIEDFAESCIELAASLKKAVRNSGKSREEVVDDINRYFGWLTTERAEALKKNNRKIPKGEHLSIHMFNHYLSKPSEYQIPGALLYAVHYVTDSLEPCKSFAEAVGGDVVYSDEKDDLFVGKLENYSTDLRTLLSKLKRNRKHR